MNDLSLIDFHVRFTETCAEIHKAYSIKRDGRPTTPSDCTKCATLQRPNMDTPKPNGVESTSLTFQSSSTAKPAEIPDAISGSETSPWAKLDVLKILTEQLLASRVRIEEQLAHIGLDIKLLTKDCETLRARLSGENVGMYDAQGSSKDCLNSEDIWEGNATLRRIDRTPNCVCCFHLMLGFMENSFIARILYGFACKIEMIVRDDSRVTC